MNPSIAPYELTAQMRRQFSDVALTVQETTPRPVRRFISAALRALANRLEPAPAAA